MRLIIAFAIVVIAFFPDQLNGQAMGDGQRAAAQTSPALSAPDVKEISGRWIGTVNADIGTMPIALDLKRRTTRCQARWRPVTETGRSRGQRSRKASGSSLSKPQRARGDDDGTGQGGS